MKAELMTKLQEMAESTVRPLPLPPNGLFPDRLLVLNKGVVEINKAEPASRDGTRLDSVGALLAFVADPVCCQDPEVYYNENGVMVLTERGYRRSVAFLRLERAQRFQTLELLAVRPQALTVVQAAKLLRFDLCAPDEIIRSLARIDFARKSTGLNVAEHGRESFGKSIEAQAQSADTLPSEFSMMVPVFVTSGAKYEVVVRCRVYLDMSAERVEIGVFPDEIQKALDDAVDNLADAIARGIAELRPGVPVFHGSPAPVAPDGFSAPMQQLGQIRQGPK